MLTELFGEMSDSSGEESQSFRNRPPTPGKKINSRAARRDSDAARRPRDGAEECRHHVAFATPIDETPSRRAGSTSEKEQR